MFKKPLEWLQNYWWGLVVAYIIIFITSYLAIWQLAEPLGIPDRVENFPAFIFSRVFVHLLATFIVSAYITLALDFWFRYTLSIKIKNGSTESKKIQQLLKTIRRIAHLQEEFSVNDWRITYSIDESGNEVLLENLTINPSKEAIYFYFKGYSIPENSPPDYTMEVSANNLIDNTPMTVLEVARSYNKIHYAILLDPPSRLDQPKSISIVCRRTDIWKELVVTHQTDGTLTATHNTNQLSIEFIAPFGRKWKAFHPAPHIGEYKINSTDGSSRITWIVPNSIPRKFAYELFLEPINR